MVTGLGNKWQSLCVKFYVAMARPLLVLTVRILDLAGGSNLFLCIEVRHLWCNLINARYR